MSDTIMYVEDSPDDVFFMERAFKKVAPGIELHVITNGQAAADFFTTSQSTETLKPLALVLLDLNLPGQSGLQVLTQIRKHSKYLKVPVIMFSASSQQSDIDMCYTEGCNAYVVKPNDPESLKTLVTIISDFWLKTNRYSKEAGGVTIISSDSMGSSSKTNP
jgi:CheY-like chemotaxis protein